MSMDGARSDNLYAYCGGDPVNREDPMGTDWLWDKDHWVYIFGTPWIDFPLRNGYRDGEVYDRAKLHSDKVSDMVLAQLNRNLRSGMERRRARMGILDEDNMVLPGDGLESSQEWLSPGAAVGVARAAGENAGGFLLSLYQLGATGLHGIEQLWGGREFAAEASLTARRVYDFNEFMQDPAGNTQRWIDNSNKEFWAKLERKDFEGAGGQVLNESLPFITLGEGEINAFTEFPSIPGPVLTFSGNGQASVAVSSGLTATGGRSWLNLPFVVHMQRDPNPTNQTKAGIQDALDELNETSKRRLGMSAKPKHHALSQEFREWFESRSINIEKLKVVLDQAIHQAIHGGGNWKLGRTWEGEWNNELMRRLSDAEEILGGHVTESEALAIAKKMILAFKLK